MPVSTGMNTPLHFAIALPLIALSCASSAPDMDHSGLTQGNVSMLLENGVTTKAEVVENFGSPNISTLDSSGNEMWVYERNAQQVKRDSSFYTIILASGSSSGFESSSRNLTLIIKFDEADVVTDFNSRYSSF